MAKISLIFTCAPQAKTVTSNCLQAARSSASFEYGPTQNLRREPPPYLKVSFEAELSQLVRLWPASGVYAPPKCRQKKNGKCPFSTHLSAKDWALAYQSPLAGTKEEQTQYGYRQFPVWLPGIHTAGAQAPTSRFLDSSRRTGESARRRSRAASSTPAAAGQEPQSPAFAAWPSGTSAAATRAAQPSGPRPEPGQRWAQWRRAASFLRPHGP